MIILNLLVVLGDACRALDCAAWRILRGGTLYRTFHYGASARFLFDTFSNLGSLAGFLVRALAAVVAVIAVAVIAVTDEIDYLAGGLTVCYFALGRICVGVWLHYTCTTWYAWYRW